MLREQEKRFPNYSAPAHELQKRRIENAVFAFIKMNFNEIHYVSIFYGFTISTYQGSLTTLKIQGNKMTLGFSSSLLY